MRIARTVGRSLVVAFTGAYHGINDEGTLVLKSYKLSLHLQELCPKQFKICLILEYGTDESLQLSANALIAAVVEPVQSRDQNFNRLPFERTANA
jgi:glutamate-1-semialdehyde aminotransferase